MHMSNSALVIVLLRYIVFYWLIHAIPRDMLLVRHAHSPEHELHYEYAYNHRFVRDRSVFEPLKPVPSIY